MWGWAQAANASSLAVNAAVCREQSSDGRDSRFCQHLEMSREKHAALAIPPALPTPTEDVALQRPMRTLEDGRQVPVNGELRRVVTGEQPRPQLVPQVGRGEVCHAGKGSWAGHSLVAWQVG